jgi:hypothetical protein
LVVDYLLGRHETRSVFAHTYLTDTAERRALQKIGFEEIGMLLHAYDGVEVPQEPCLLYAKHK